MSTERLLDSMTREAERRRGEILADARAEEERIVREARQRAEAVRTSARTALTAEIANLATQSRERAEAEADRSVFLMRDAVLRKSSEAACERLAALAASPNFVPALNRLLEEALDAASEADDLVVRVPVMHAGALRSRVEAAGAELRADASIADGVMVEDRAGTFRVTNTLTLRMERLEGTIRTEAFAVLFGREADRS